MSKKRASAAETSLADSTASEEMYLKALERLEREGKATVATVSRELGVSAASTSEMLHRLAARGWVTVGKSGAALTPTGRRLALRTVRRHRLVERLFTDILELPWEGVHEPACRLEHAVSDLVADQIEEVLGHPETCPHGNPIPARDGTVAEESGVGLDSLGPGARARVLSISREDPDLLTYLSSLGLLPGTDVRIETAAPFGGPLLVRVGRARYALGREVASVITVDPDGGAPH